MTPFCIYCNTNTIHIGNICYKRASEDQFMNSIGELEKIEQGDRMFSDDIKIILITLQSLFQITLFDKKECKLLDYNQLEQQCVLTIDITNIMFTIKDNIQGQKTKHESQEFRFIKDDIVYAAITKIGHRKGLGLAFLLSFYLKNQQIFTFGPFSQQDDYDKTLSFIENNYAHVTERTINILGQNWGDVAVDNRLVTFAQLDHQNDDEPEIESSQDEYQPGDSQVNEENQENEDSDDIDDSPCPNPIFQIPVNTITSYTKIGQKDVQIELQHVTGLKSCLYLKSATFGFPSSEECLETFNLLQRYVTIDDENRVFFLENVQCYTPSGKYHLIMNRDGIKLQSTKEIDIKQSQILRTVITEHDQGFLFTIQTTRSEGNEFITFLVTTKSLNNLLYIKEEEEKHYESVVVKNQQNQYQLNSVPACNVIALLFQNLYSDIHLFMSPYVVSQINNDEVQQNNCLNNDNTTYISCIYKRPTKTCFIYFLSNYLVIAPLDVSLVTYKEIRALRITKDDKNSGNSTFARMQIITNSGINYLFTRIKPSEVNLVSAFFQSRKFNIKIDDKLQELLEYEQREQNEIIDDEEATEDWQEGEESSTEQREDDKYEYETSDYEPSSESRSSQQSEKNIQQKQQQKQTQPTQKKQRREKIIYQQIQLSPDDIEIEQQLISQM